MHGDLAAGHKTSKPKKCYSAHSRVQAALLVLLVDDVMELILDTGALTLLGLRLMEAGLATACGEPQSRATHHPCLSC